VHPDLKTAVELQRVDLEIAKLSTQVDEIPSQIQSIQAQLNHSLGAHEERKLRLTANQKERRDLEGEIKVIQEKISKHKDQLYQVKTNEQYRAMQREIEGEEQNIRTIEDRILEKMVEAESLQKLVQDAAARLEDEKTRVAGETKRLESARQAAEEERSQRLARRATLAEGLSASIRETYERVRRGRNGVAVAEVRDGFCTGCNVRLRPQMYNEVRTGESIATCDSCSRLLYYAEPATDVTEMAEGRNHQVAL
jgi:predicted  nucleic acid-binding Zn-ribbon protein